MRELVDEIFGAFIFMVITFAASTLMSFWVLMSVSAATVSSVLFILSATQWWRQCNKLYNTFKFDRNAHLYQFNEDASDTSSNIGPNVRGSSFASSVSTEVTAATTPSRGLFGWLRKSNPSVQDQQQQQQEQQQKPRRRTRRNSVESMHDCRYCGYVSLEDRPVGSGGSSGTGGSSGIVSASSWSRVFLYLSKSGDLYYFNTKADCPASPVNSRAIETSLYNVQTEQIPFNASSSSSSSTVAASTSGESKSEYEFESEYAYEIRLVRKEEGSKFRVWKFRLDTQDEMLSWTGHLQGLPQHR